MNTKMSFLILLSALALSSCGSSADGSVSFDVESSTTTTISNTPTTTTVIPTETTTTTTNTTTTTADTTTTATETTTTTTTTEATTTAKEYDRSYYSFGEQKEIKLKYDVILYYAPDKSSDGLYNFNAGTILIAVGETNDYFAVTMNDDIVFCEKVAAEYYYEPIITTTDAPPVDTYEPPQTFVITD